MSIKTLKIKKLDKTPAKEINPYFKDVKKNKINPIINKIMCQGTVLCHTSRIYIYLIESPPAVKRISIFNFSTS